MLNAGFRHTIGRLYQFFPRAFRVICPQGRALGIFLKMKWAEILARRLVPKIFTRNPDEKSPFLPRIDATKDLGVIPSVISYMQK